jgi:hypothetical protein
MSRLPAVSPAKLGRTYGPVMRSAGAHYIFIGTRGCNTQEPAHRFAGELQGEAVHVPFIFIARPQPQISSPFHEKYVWQVVCTDGIIHIPSQYLQNISSPVKVILLTGDETRNKTGKTFSAIKLKTKGFKFDRDTANERQSI